MTATASTLPLPARGRVTWRAGAWAAGVAAGALLFWWGATGALLALQRDADTRLAALVLALACGAGGVWCVRRAHTAEGAAGGAWASLGGALLWTAVSAAFYGGWVVGPRAPGAVERWSDAVGAAATWPRARAAVAATWHSSALALALFAVACVTARRDSARGGDAAAFGPGTFVALWVAHELARLNVFLGVANAGGELLPAYLAHLRVYFGPAHNSPLLGPSVVALATGAAAAVAAARAATPSRRTGWLLVGGVLALAALEHALLGTRVRVGWWDAFLRWRGVA